MDVIGLTGLGCNPYIVMPSIQAIDTLDMCSGLTGYAKRPSHPMEMWFVMRDTSGHGWVKIPFIFLVYAW